MTAKIQSQFVERLNNSNLSHPNTNSQYPLKQEKTITYNSHFYILNLLFFVLFLPVCQVIGNLTQELYKYTYTHSLEIGNPFFLDQKYSREFLYLIINGVGLLLRIRNLNMIEIKQCTKFTSMYVSLLYSLNQEIFCIHNTQLCL